MSRRQIWEKSDYIYNKLVKIVQLKAIEAAVVPECSASSASSASCCTQTGNDPLLYFEMVSWTLSLHAQISEQLAFHSIFDILRFCFWIMRHVPRSFTMPEKRKHEEVGQNAFCCQPAQWAHVTLLRSLSWTLLWPLVTILQNWATLLMTL